MDSSGNIYVTGAANSADFPTANPLQASLSGIGKAFIAKIGNPQFKVAANFADCSFQVDGTTYTGTQYFAWQRGSNHTIGVTTQDAGGSEATRLVERNQATLAGIPAAFFTVCLTMQRDPPENRRTVENYMAPVVKKLHPPSIGLFGGRMNYSRLGFLDRLIVSKMKKVPEGDYRDWAAIRTWAGNEFQDLSNHASPPPDHRGECGFTPTEPA